MMNTQVLIDVKEKNMAVKCKTFMNCRKFFYKFAKTFGDIDVKEKYGLQM